MSSRVVAIALRAALSLGVLAIGSLVVVYLVGAQSVRSTSAAAQRTATPSAARSATPADIVAPSASPSAAAAAAAPKAAHIAPATTTKHTRPAAASSAAVAAADPGGLPAITSVSASTAHATSSNWAGWLVTGGGHRQVSASWVQPAVSCAAGENSSAAFWVGLDGAGSNTVEQTGVSSECMNGTAVVDAWYEFYPEASVSIARTVAAGDRLTASATLSGSTVTVDLVDSTRGWTFSTQRTMSGTLGASAEVVAEAPSLASTGQQIPLSDFGQVTFGQVTLDGVAIASDPSAFAVDMVASVGTIAATSDLSGSAFAVAWRGSGLAVATSSTAASSTGSTGTGSAGTGATTATATTSPTPTPVATAAATPAPSADATTAPAG